MPLSSDVTEAASGGLSEKAVIEIDALTFPKDAALKAAYSMSDRCTVRLLTIPSGNLAAEIRRKDGDAHTSLDTLSCEFETTLLDFALRIRVADETREIQSALLKRAFSEALPKAG